jgi:hypothetical protein
VIAGVCIGVERGHVEVRFSNRAHGDLNADVVAADVVDRRWLDLAERPVTWLDEVHGTEVVVVDAPGASAGRIGDGMVTTVAGAALGIWVGDCAPRGARGRRGRGRRRPRRLARLEAGVLHEVVTVMRRLGATEIAAVIGPCLHVECNEFGPADLERFVARFGPDVAAPRRGVPPPWICPPRAGRPSPPTASRWRGRSKRARAATALLRRIAPAPKRNATAWRSGWRRHDPRSLSPAWPNGWRTYAPVSRAGGKDVRVVAVTKGFGPRPSRLPSPPVAATSVRTTPRSSLAKLSVRPGAEPGRSTSSVHLQTNKIRQLVPVVDVWQSVDRVEVVDVLARRAAPSARCSCRSTWPVSRSRVAASPDDTPQLVAAATDAGLDVVGLMAIGHPAGRWRRDRDSGQLRQLVDDLGSPVLDGDVGRSRGRVEEGSTMVRVGTALFGPRQRHPSTAQAN